MPTPTTPFLPAGAAPADAPRPRLVARMLSRTRRRQLEEAIAAGRLREGERIDLLAVEGLRALARKSLQLLVGGGVAFAGLNLAVRAVRHSAPLLGESSPAARALVLVLANAAAYIVMVPVHEALHAATIVALGGRPRFGLKLPFAAYCTAPGQLFTRDGYTVVALAPMVVLSAAGAVLTWLSPDVAACVLFGLAGNVSGAVGDLDTVARLRRRPSATLVADTETGYIAYEPAL
jgi:putative zincin peptidase